MITLPSEPLIDGPTTLRRWRDGDQPALAVLCRDPEITRWIGLPAGYDLADARDYLAGRAGAARDGLEASFAITETATGELLGSIGLLRMSWPDRRAEIGYWLGAPARGQGHATRATRLVCRWGIRTLGLERVELLVQAGNLASLAVAQRAGFVREARLRDHVEQDDGRADMIVFGRLATDPD